MDFHQTVAFSPRYLRVYSDLHLNKQAPFFPPEDGLESETLLVLAGDTLHFVDFLKDEPEPYAIKFLRHVSMQFPRVLLIPGNHEHYHTDTASPIITEARKKLNTLGLSNIIIPDNQILSFQNADFICSSAFPTVVGNIEAYGHLTAEDIQSMSDADAQFLNYALTMAYEAQSARPQILVTHFPVLNRFLDDFCSQDPKVNCRPLTNSALLNAMDVVIWGHIHSHFTEHDRENRVLYTSNPRGVIERGDNPLFDIQFRIDLKTINKNK